RFALLSSRPAPDRPERIVRGREDGWSGLSLLPGLAPRLYSLSRVTHLRRAPPTADSWPVTLAARRWRVRSGRWKLPLRPQFQNLRTFPSTVAPATAQRRIAPSCRAFRAAGGRPA